MKIKNLKYYTVVFITICFAVNSYAQQADKGYSSTMEMTADEKGDIQITAVTKYSAAYWDYMKQSKALEPSIMKNTIKRQFPKYQIVDFNMDSKSGEEDRKSTVKFTVQGSLKLDENGKWIADLDTKNPDITKISDNQFVLVDKEASQTLKINLPKSATNSKVENDNFGKAILTYTAPVASGGMSNILKYLGFAVIAGGIFLFFKSRGLNTVFVKNTQQQKINYKNTKEINDAVIVNHSVKENITSANGFKSNQE
ncbi:hypothetical protein [Ferruginibacter sp.]